MLYRKILSKIWEKIDNDQILLLNGARQVGKTSLMLMIQEKLTREREVRQDQILWFDLEKIGDLDIWSNQNTALAILPLNNNSRQYIFIDEFQKSKNIGSILKVLHDHYPQFKIILTGSASWYLTLDESLAGRKQVFEIWPLDFEEFIEWKNDQKITDYYRLAKKDIDNATPTMIETINNVWLEFMTYGGYPAAVKAESRDDKINILSELVNAYLMRDIKIWNYAANSLQIKKLLTLLASDVAGLLDTNNLSTNTGLGRTALLNRLELLQNTFIVYLNKPFFKNKTKEMVKNPKTYLVDTGLRQSLMNNFSLIAQTRDFGLLAENAVVMEMLKHSDPLRCIKYWRTKTGQEVDIVCEKENRLLPIEVKSGDENKLPAGIKSFVEIYQPTTAYVLNWSIIQEIDYQQTKIYFRPLWYLE